MKAVWFMVSVLVLLTGLGGCAWIEGLLNPNHVPVAAITASGISGEPPLEIFFDGLQSYDPDGDEISYKWDFGDGKIGQGQTVTHVFTSSGNHIVQLIVTDTKGAEGLSSITIIVTLETVSDAIGISGGTVSTSQGSSVTIPVNTLADGSVVSISELAESPVQFKSDVTPLENGVVVSLSSSGVSHAATASTSSLDATPAVIAIKIPLPASPWETPPHAREGVLIRFLIAGEFIQVLLGMEREGNSLKVQIPVIFISKFVAKTIDKQNNTNIQPQLFIDAPIIDMILSPFVWYTEHIAPQLYRYGKDSKLTVVNDLESKDITPIILVHGYKIWGGDVVIAGYPGAITSAKQRVKDHWGAFHDYFYSHCVEHLNELVPNRRFELYGYRWDTDEGIDKAGTALAEFIHEHFGNREFILIGHSAGGIVARACVEHNQELVSNFPGIITLASPHLGVPLEVGASLFLDKTGEELSQRNTWLQNLNRDARCTDKLIVYGGYITPSYTHGLILSFGYWLSKLISPGEKNDGIVLLHSALAEGYNVKKRHSAYRDYDHGEMLNDRAGYGLFTELCFDLQDLARGLMSPMETAQLSISIEPSTASFNTALDRALGWHYTVTISEAGGIAAEIEKVTWDYYDINGNWITTESSGSIYFDSYFNTHQVPAGGNISSHLFQMPLPKEEIAITEWTVFGTDGNGKEVQASAIVYLAQDVHRGMTVSIIPDPVMLQPGDGWHYDISISGINAVGIIIIGVQKVYHDNDNILEKVLTKGSNYAKQIFGTDYVLSGGSISATISESYHSYFYDTDWTIVGMDDHGRTVYGAYGVDLNHGGDSNQELSKLMPLGIPK
jgi:PKD repeat protein